MVILMLFGVFVVSRTKRLLKKGKEKKLLTNISVYARACVLDVPRQFSKSGL